MAFPPYVVGSDTSYDAARSMAGKTGSIRRRVFDLIVSWDGATDDEIEAHLELRHQTASARRRELVTMGLIEDSGARRATRSGRSAVVWTVRRPDGQRRMF